MLIRPLDTAALHEQYLRARPFPHVVVDDFLQRDFALEVARALPSPEAARGAGRPAAELPRDGASRNGGTWATPLRRLLDELRGGPWLEQLAAITGTEHLLADEDPADGGLQRTARGGRLDVHVDPTTIPGTELFRRVNLLLYLNPLWEEDWGGELELWDAAVQECRVRLLPILGRCVILETSARSFHGTTRLRAPRPITRYALSLYYGTREAPADQHDALPGRIYRARPRQRLKGRVLLPLGHGCRRVGEATGRLWQRLRGRE